MFLHKAAFARSSYTRQGLSTLFEYILKLEKLETWNYVNVATSTNTFSCTMGNSLPLFHLDSMLLFRNWNHLTLFNMTFLPTYSTWGGAIWPPCHKIPWKCPLGLKLGRVPQGGLNMTFKPKSPNQVSMDVHKGIMKIAPQTAFCRDFAELL